MTTTSPQTSGHDHFFLGGDHQRNERKVWLVIALTASMMLVEITAGTVYGSMALVADGWHMSTHAGAMLIAALAYRFARRHVGNPRFTFGTGKLGDLAGFASAVLLALIALLIGWESMVRLTQPIHIDFEQAIAVAIMGLIVNLVCAWLLKDDHSHSGHHHHHGHDHHDHDHHDEHHEPGKGRDNNLRAAYLHVMADALTSVLAIVALLLGGSYGWTWADPVMGAVGALVIARWSWGLIRDTGSVLLDAAAEGEEVREEIREAIAPTGSEVTDLHVWQVGPGHFAAIVSLIAQEPRERDASCMIFLLTKRFAVHTAHRIPRFGAQPFGCSVRSARRTRLASLPPSFLSSSPATVRSARTGAVKEESAGLVRPAGAAEDTALRALTARGRGLQSRAR